MLFWNFGGIHIWPSGHVELWFSGGKLMKSDEVATAVESGAQSVVIQEMTVVCFVKNMGEWRYCQLCVHTENLLGGL